MSIGDFVRVRIPIRTYEHRLATVAATRPSLDARHDDRLWLEFTTSEVTGYDEATESTAVFRTLATAYRILRQTRPYAEDIDDEFGDALGALADLLVDTVEQHLAASLRLTAEGHPFDEVSR